MIPVMKTTHEKVINSLYRKVSSGSMSVGKRLDSERSLAQQLGCSRVTVRKALQELEDSGLVMRLQGKGTFLLNDVQKKKVALIPTKKLQVGVGIFNTSPRGFHSSFIQGLQDALSSGRGF